MWVAFPQLIADKLSGRRIPRIRRAFRFEPVGQLPDLRPVLLRGEVELDPRSTDIFARVAEERELAKALGTAEGDRLERSLKNCGNTQSYGLAAEYRPRRLRPDELESVVIYGRGHEPFTRELANPEDPGPWCFPPIATLVPAGARLLLALARVEVRRLGGAVAYEDTDSVFVVSTEAGGLVACAGGDRRLPDGGEAVYALSWVELQQTIDRFSSLNPFDTSLVPGSIFKLEKENLGADGRQRELRFFGRSSKRYCLFTIDSDGQPTIAKGSDHGLGHLLDPTRQAEDDDDPDAAKRFNHELWGFLLGRELDLDPPEPDWLDLPAVGRTSLSTPEAIDAFTTYNAGKPYEEQVKPFGFGLTCYAQPLGRPPGVDPLTFHLVGPFERNSDLWRDLRWFDLATGQEYVIRTGNPAFAAGNVVVVKSYRDVLDEFVRHPEAKLADADGEPCGRDTRGLLRRREVTISGFTHIGKEARDLDRRQEGSVHELADVQNDYGDGDVTSRGPSTVCLRS